MAASAMRADSTLCPTLKFIKEEEYHAFQVKPFDVKKITEN